MKYMLYEGFVPFRVAIVGAVFFAFFILLIVYVYSKRQKSKYETISMLPLEDGTSVGNQSPVVGE